MAVVGVTCLATGWLRQGWQWRGALTALGCLATGTAFVAIGLLELEWLERIVGFADGVVSGLIQWWRTSQSGTLSDSELVGRWAAVIWVVVGVPIYVWGCLTALRVVDF
jgi:hypothetical protein